MHSTFTAALLCCAIAAPMAGHSKTVRGAFTGTVTAASCQPVQNCGNNIVFGQAAHHWVGRRVFVTFTVDTTGAGEDVSPDPSVWAFGAPGGSTNFVQSFVTVADVNISQQMSLETYNQPGTIDDAISVADAASDSFSIRSAVHDDLNGNHYVVEMSSTFPASMLVFRNLDALRFFTGSSASSIAGTGIIKTASDFCCEQVIAFSTDSVAFFGGTPLQGRLPATPGGTNYQAYYDTELDVTWLADTTFGGVDTWDGAQAVVTALNATSHLGLSNWRLPRVIPINGSYFQRSGPYDLGRNISAFGSDFPASTANELAHLFYWTLGNTYDGSPNPQGCPRPGGLVNCLTDPGPFHFHPQPSTYWTGTEAPWLAYNEPAAFLFGFADGSSNYLPRSWYYSIWPVRDGDVDSDSDGRVDHVDNCRLTANPDQCDSDGDGYGNHCDGDLNNNGFTNSQDSVLFRAQLGQPSAAPAYNPADLNCNGFVNAQDQVLFRRLLGKPVGPSGLLP